MSIEGLPGIIAWIGEDEHGSGEIGIKFVIQNSRYTALALTEDQTDVMGKLADEYMRAGMQLAANEYGKTRRLVRFVPVEEILVVEPEGGQA